MQNNISCHRIKGSCDSPNTLLYVFPTVYSISSGVVVVVVVAVVFVAGAAATDQMAA